MNEIDKKQKEIERKRKKKETNKRYAKAHREKIKIYQKQYRQLHVEQIKNYREQNKEILALKANERAKRWYQRNKEHCANYKKEYRNNHKDIINRCHRNRYTTDINYHLAFNLRTRLYMAIKDNQKVGSAIRDLGCSIDELKLRLQRMFYPNPETGEQMTWDNYGKGGWEIDHIIPLSSFNLADRGEFLEANHWTNLQPMWRKENLKKLNKIFLNVTDDKDYENRLLSIVGNG